MHFERRWAVVVSISIAAAGSVAAARSDEKGRRDPVGGAKAGVPVELAAPVMLECDGKPIDMAAAIGHAGPVERDLDGDGRLDLVVGNFGGHFQLFANRGTRQAPVYTALGDLKAGGEVVQIHNW
jgi:hypothetical protein